MLFLQYILFRQIAKDCEEMKNKKLISVIAAILVVLALVSWCIYEIHTATRASDLSENEAQAILNKEYDAIAVTNTLKYIAQNNKIKVKSLSYGEEKNVILSCEVETLDVYGALSSKYDSYLDAEVKKKNGTMFKSSLDFKMEFEEEIIDTLKNADKITNRAELMLYETKDGFKIYTTNEAINAVFGGIYDIKTDVNKIKEVSVPTLDGKTEKKAILSTNVNKGFVECFEARTSTQKPETSEGIVKIYNSIKNDFEINFIRHDRWKTIFKGLWVTIKLTFFALIIGIILGFLVAFVRCTYLKTTKHGIILRFFNSIAQVYLTVIRGTPAVVQIMIIYFVIFMPLGVDKFLSAVVCFGLNSGAYVAEIVRGGIMSVDDGQIEAGRSLGFNYMQTMMYIVFPQAFKAVLPALANEFVVLLKETSVAFYIGLGDLMYAGNAIRSATYSPFMPLVAVAIIYLIMVLGLSRLVGILERRLRNNER